MSDSPLASGVYRQVASIKMSDTTPSVLTVPFFGTVRDPMDFVKELHGLNTRIRYQVGNEEKFFIIKNKSVIYDPNKRLFTIYSDCQNPPSDFVFSWKSVAKTGSLPTCSATAVAQASSKSISWVWIVFIILLIILIIVLARR